MKMIETDMLRMHKACDKVLLSNGIMPKEINSTKKMWQVFHAAERHDPGLNRHLYNYLNDANIETALKRIYA